MALRALFLCGAATLALLLACKEDEAKPPLTDGVATSVGGGSSPDDAGATPILDSGDDSVCSTATIMGFTVDQQSVNANLPTANGGAITDGTYDLELDQIYVGIGGLGTPTGVSVASTLVVTGNRIERLDRVIDATGISTPSVQSGTYQLTNASGAFYFTCPLTLSEPFAFTAGNDAGTDDTLTILRAATNEARTYRRRL